MRLNEQNGIHVLERREPFSYKRREETGRPTVEDAKPKYTYGWTHETINNNYLNISVQGVKKV